MLMKSNLWTLSQTNGKESWIWERFRNIILWNILHTFFKLTFSKIAFYHILTSNIYYTALGVIQLKLRWFLNLGKQEMLKMQCLCVTPNSHTILIEIKRYYCNRKIERHFSYNIVFPVWNKYIYFMYYAYWNLVWKYFKMSVQYFISKLCAM